MRTRTGSRAVLPLVVALAACAERTEDTPPALLEELDAPVWDLPAEPSFEVGTEDSEPYQLDQVRGALRLSNGNVAVLDGGSSELRIFDRDGDYVETVAGKGSGPGEFQSPWTLYRRGDSIFVVDSRARNLSLFGPDGRFIETRPADLHGGAGNVYLHDGSVVVGPPEGGSYAGMDEVVARLPRPRSYVREIRVAGDDRLWLRSDTGSSEWFVMDATPAPVGRIRIPENFAVHEVGRDYVLGVWSDSLGVQSVRAYDLPAGADVRQVSPGARAPSGTAEHESLRVLLERMQLHQEHYYSRPEAEYTYARTMDELSGFTPPAGAGLQPLEIPAGTIVRILHSDSRGWFGVAVDTVAGATCATGIGLAGPPGWTNGTTACSRAGE